MDDSTFVNANKFEDSSRPETTYQTVYKIDRTDIGTVAFELEYVVRNAIDALWRNSDSFSKMIVFTSGWPVGSEPYYRLFSETMCKYANMCSKSCARVIEERCQHRYGSVTVDLLTNVMTSMTNYADLLAHLKRIKDANELKTAEKVGIETTSL